MQAVAGHPMIDEVLVIDDASHDNTAEVAASTSGITLIRQRRNGGKTRALVTGFSAMQGDHVLLLDADLLGLTAADVTALITPIHDGDADMTISLRANAPWPWRLIGLDYISGERVMHRNLLPPQDALARLPNFGFEVYLNERAIASRARIGVVGWPGVKSPAKEATLGIWNGLQADLKMMRDIFRTVPPHRLLRQIAAMRHLSNRSDI